MKGFDALLGEVEAFARAYPQLFETLGKDALPLVVKLLHGEFDEVRVEYDRRRKAESVAAARALIRLAREDGADVDSFLSGIGHLAAMVLRTSASALI